MEKSLIVTILFLISQLSYSQYRDSEFMWLKPQNKNVKTLRKFENNKPRLLQEFDKAGNCHFVKNDSLNGDVIAIWGIYFDNIGREIKTIFAHSNIGVEIYETEYSPNYIKIYSYTSDTLESLENLEDSSSAVVADDYQFNRFNSIKVVQSKADLEKLQMVIECYQGKKYLNEIIRLNNENNAISSYSFNYKGDTISYSFSEYYEGMTKESWGYSSQKIIDYLYYDNQKNKIKSYRIYEHKMASADTSEFKIFDYDSDNRIIKITEKERGRIVSTKSYKYNKNLLIEKKYLNMEKKKDPLLFTYSYNQLGEVIEENIINKEGRKIISNINYKTTYEYW